MENNGIVKGEICNRDGCKGIIGEHEKEGSCSCHNNPPCSYCTTDTAYCPECGWESVDEPEPQIDPEVAKRNLEYYNKQMEEWQHAELLFNRRYQGHESIEELEIRSYSHTHISMIKKGVFPKGTETIATILPKVKGTFGGRFERFTETTFEYIAYTD